MSSPRNTFLGFPPEIISAIGRVSEPLTRSALDVQTGRIKYKTLEDLKVPGLCYLENSSLTEYEKQALFERLAYWPQLHSLCTQLEKIGKLVDYLSRAKLSVTGDEEFKYIHVDESGGPGGPGDALFYVITTGHQELLGLELIWSKDINKYPQIFSESQVNDYSRWYNGMNECRCENYRGTHTHTLMYELTIFRKDIDLPEASCLRYECDVPNCKYHKQYEHTHGTLDIGHIGRPDKGVWHKDGSLAGPIQAEYTVHNPRLASSDDRTLSLYLFDAIIDDDDLKVLTGTHRVGGGDPTDIGSMDRWVEILVELARNGRMSDEAKEEILHSRPVWVNNQSILKHYLKQPDRCYLSLLAASDEAMSLRPDKFCHVVKTVADNAGTLPTGREVIGAIAPAIAEQALGPMSTDNHGQFFAKSKEIQEKMLNSKARFTIEEKPDCLHIEVKSFSDCLCRDGDLHCVDHGWTAKYPMTAVATTKLRVGGLGTELGVDFNKFFEESAEVDSTVLPGPVNSGFRVITPLNIRKQRPDKPTGSPAKQPHKKEEDPFPSPFEYQYHDSDEDEVEEQHSHTSKLRRADDEVASQIGPTDSSSNIGRYTPSELACSRKYMKQGTVMTVRKARGGGVVEESRVLYELPAIPEVVAGFIRTESIASAEVLSHHQVRPINGLAKPFRNNRLNFLMHLHTAIHNLRPQDSGSVLSTIKRLKSRKVGSPSMELLFQVIKVTFDFEDHVVKGNPHKLPYIEPGMILTDDVMNKCFSLLYSQYQVEWFNEVKDLRTPRFTGDPIMEHHHQARPRRTSDSSISVGSQRARSVLGILSGNT